jgi:hypothetical protein
MTAVIYNFNRAAETDTANDAAERLFSALGRYTSAELLELLYVGEEPGFFELMRGFFGLSDEGRMILQDFLAASINRRTSVTIDRDGRCVLAHDLAPNLKRDVPHVSLVRQQDPA